MFIQMYGTDLLGLPVLFSRSNYATYILSVISLLDGYTPNRAVLYPEGKDGPAVEIGSTRRMLYDSPKSTHRNVPTYFYGASGSYRPAIVLVNDAGWRPDGKTISSDLVEMAQPIVVP